jgi:hypothetical protein
VANRQTSNGWEDATYGVLKLTLHSSSYDWQFVDENGVTAGYDSATGVSCH